MTDTNRELRIEYVDLDDLRSADRNPKQHDLPTIRASLSRFGVSDVAAILNESTGRLVAGHGRITALREMRGAGDPVPVGVHVSGDGAWTVPVLHGVSFANEAEAEAFLLAHNRTTELGGWDATHLKDMLEDHRLDLEATGFTVDDLRPLGSDDNPDDDDPTPPSAPTSQPGDRWTVGPHVLVCGSSTDPATWDLLNLPNPADMVWTDPPYGIDYVGKTKAKLTVPGDGKADYADLIATVLPITKDHSRPGAVWFVASSPGPAMLPFAQILTDLGIWRSSLAWVKDQFVLGRSDYHARHECLFYGWNPGAAHKAPPTRTLDSILEYARPRASTDHPTMKPVDLIADCIRNHTRPDELILDPFAGSGSTLLAAAQTERTGYGIELDPTYADVIVRRLAHHTGHHPTLNGTPQPPPPNP